MANDFLQNKIAVTETIIEAYETAITSLTSEELNIESYTLDTGQTRQVVTRRDLTRLSKELDSLYNRHAMLDARCGVNRGRNVVTVVPSF